MDDGMEYALVLLVAPAGSGKTALLRRWAQERQWPIAWVTLEPADNLPRRFLMDLITALHVIGYRTETLPMDGLDNCHFIETIVDLINGIVEIPHEFALILDSYEAIKAPEIHESVRLLLDYLPPPMHLIIASRTEPPLQLPRLRARRQLIELGPQDLSNCRPDAPGTVR